MKQKNKSQNKPEQVSLFFLLFSITSNILITIIVIFFSMMGIMHISKENTVCEIGNEETGIIKVKYDQMRDMYPTWTSNYGIMRATYKNDDREVRCFYEPIKQEMTKREWIQQQIDLERNSGIQTIEVYMLTKNNTWMEVN